MSEIDRSSYLVFTIWGILALSPFVLVLYANRRTRRFKKTLVKLSPEETADYAPTVTVIIDGREVERELEYFRSQVGRFTIVQCSPKLYEGEQFGRDCRGLQVIKRKKKRPRL